MLKKMVIVYPSNAGFPTGVANMGGTGESSSKFDGGRGGRGGGLKSKHGSSMGEA